MKITRKQLQTMIRESIKAISSGSPDTASKALATLDVWNSVKSPDYPDNRRERDPAVADMLADMWKATNRSSWEKYWKLSKQGSTEGAWSAAFVSFVEDDPGFNDSIRHSDYMNAAEAEREKFDKGEDMFGKHVAFKPGEVETMPGDKRCHRRSGGKHCDVCLEPGCNSFIGGNIDNDIRIRTDGGDSPDATMFISKSPIKADAQYGRNWDPNRTGGPKGPATGDEFAMLEEIKNEDKNIMKITRAQLKQIIKEELRYRKIISEGFASLPDEHKEDIVADVYAHVGEMIENAWPKADIVPGMSLAAVDLNRGGLNQFTLTYEFMTVGTGTGLAGLKGVERKWKNKVAGNAGYKSYFLDNTKNKVFKMRLAKNPIEWSTEKKDGYVFLTVLITLNEDYVADHQPIDGL